MHNVCIIIVVMHTLLLLCILYCCREESSLVDVFVMEMLVYMVNSLKLSHKDERSLGKD